MKEIKKIKSVELFYNEENETFIFTVNGDRSKKGYKFVFAKVCEFRYKRRFYAIWKDVFRI